MISFTHFTQSALRACVFVLKQLLALAGAFQCRTFRKLYRAALPFQREIAASENENTFIARCYWRNNSRSDFVVNAYWAIVTTDRLIDRSISIDVKPEQPLLLDMKTRQKQVVRILTSSSLDVTGANYSNSPVNLWFVIKQIATEFFSLPYIPGWSA